MKNENNDSDFERDQSADAENFDNTNFSFDDEEDDFDSEYEITPSPVSPSDVTDDKAEDLSSRAQLKEEKKKERKESRKQFLKKIRIPAIIVLAVILAAVVAIYAYALSTISSDKIMNNVYIESLNVGRLSYDEAVDAIGNSYLFENSEITLKCGDKTYALKSEDIGISALAEDTAQRAMDYCKTGNFIKDGFDAIKLMFGSYVVSPSAEVNTEMLDEKLNEFGNIVLGERIQHYVDFNDDQTVTIHPGTTGYDGNPEEARNAVIEALKKSQFSDIKVKFASAAPDEMTIERFDSLVYKDAVNAEYYVENNQVSIINGQTGRYINKEEAEPLIKNVHEGGESVTVPIYVSQPEYTSSMLRDRLFNATLGSCSTSYSTSTENRCANVARAASLINGTVIPPGETFSFNKTVGHRTVENGFYTAKEYVNGKSVDGIGGGTCQVSSTLYSAVLYADLAIVERTNHMMTVGYIPLGQDATVTDGGLDFRFKNNTDSPVKISATTSGKTITVNIIGTQWSPAREVKIVSTSSQSGENTLVNTVREVYINGQLSTTEKLPSSSYAPHEG